MKKLLLMTAVALTALTANADGLTPADKMQKVKIQGTKIAVQQQLRELSKSENQKAPQRTIADDCWYSRPIGSMVYGFNTEGHGYYNAWTVVAPYKQFTFDNQCSNPSAAKWFIVSSSEGEVDLSEYCDENNNFIYECNGEHGYLIPHISNNGAEFVWGKDNRYNGTTTYSSTIRTLMDVSPLRNTDPHLGPDYIGWGILDTNFLYGDGRYQLKDQETGEVLRTLQSFGAIQNFPKPMSPLYVENIFIDLLLLDKKGNPLSEGDQMKMIIMDKDGNTLHELVCDPEDVTVDEETSSTDYGEMQFSTAVFSVKEKDPLTGEMAAAPFILDQEFTVAIIGFEGKGIGLRGHSCTNEEAAEAALWLGEDNFRGGLMFYDVDDQEFVRTLTYQKPICVPITFNAFFDGAEVLETAELEDGTIIEDFNVLKVSADAATVVNAGYDQANFVQVNLARSWFDADDNEQYIVATADEEFPEWITGVAVDNENWVNYNPETEYPEPTVKLGVECDPLPEGVEGRGVKLYVYGAGIQSEQPIYILQGEYTKEQCDNGGASGITSVAAVNNKTNNKVFNLMGQQVSANHKGIVIKNGKKIVKK